MKDLFSSNNMKTLGFTLAGCLLALALHQKFIAPRISPKKA
jgi:hypothetical protein